MKKAWFTRKGRFYKPLSIYGWLVAGIALVYIGYSVIRILNLQQKLNQTLADIALQVIITAVAYVLIAYSTQQRKA